MWRYHTGIDVKASLLPSFIIDRMVKQKGRNYLPNLMLEFVSYDNHSPGDTCLLVQ